MCQLGPLFLHTCWNDGSVVKNTFCFYRGHEFKSQHLSNASITCLMITSPTQPYTSLMNKS